MRILLAVLIALLFAVNIWLWKTDDAGVRKLRTLQTAVKAQKAETEALRERNSALEAEVRSLKEGEEAMEERARVELGMIRQDETFFYILEQTPTDSSVLDEAPK
jgi:cell division protein FtsB